MVQERLDYFERKSGGSGDESSPKTTPRRTQ
jgi:hypothetical protein